MKTFDLNYVNQCFTYNPRTGDITWRSRPLEHFASEPHYRSWNTRYAGTGFGCPHISRTPTYIVGNLDRKQIRAHRLAWALHYGEWPSGQIDHINHDGTDNRIDNLRVVTRAENAKNVPLSRANRSGATGVHFDKSRQLWVAYITQSGKRSHLGYFGSMGGALSARAAAESRMGFHPNHGAARMTNNDSQGAAA